MTYPERALGQRLEFAPGANLTANPATWVWQEHTDALYRVHDVTSEVGGADEASETFSELTFSLRDPNGRYTHNNPESDLYPYFDVDMPVRWSTNTWNGEGWVVECVQFIGEMVDEWIDGTPNMKITRVVASGMFRRMGQGGLIQSPLTRAILGSDAVEYWPCNTGAESLTAPSGIPGRAVMSPDGVVKFGAVAGFAGSPGSYPEFFQPDEYAGRLIGPVSYVGTGTGYTIEFWFKIRRDAESASTSLGILRWTTTGTFGGLQETPGVYAFGWEVYADHFTSGAEQLIVAAIHPNGTSQTNAATGILSMDDEWHQVRIEVEQVSGVLANCNLYYDGLGPVDNFSSATFPLVGQPIAVYTSWYSNWDPGFASFLLPIESLSVGEIAIYDTALLITQTYQFGLGAKGGTASARMQRLADEESVTASILGSPSTTLMGPQLTDRVLANLRDVENSDHGILTDHLGMFGYRTFAHMTNQTPAMTLNGANRELFTPFQPVRDDQKRRNRVKATRPGGAQSAIYTHPTADPASPEYNPARGIYDDDIDVNISTDDRLLDHASFAVEMSMIEGKRYPSLMLDMHVAPHLISAWRSTILGDTVLVTKAPGERDDVELLVRGWSQVWRGGRGWTVQLNMVRADPYRMFVIEGTENGNRLETRGNTTSAAYGPTDTSIVVVTSAGNQLLTTTATFPADFPVDVVIAGEVVRVTAIVGATSPQTMTVTRSINGVRKILPAGSQVKLYQPRGVSF